AGSAAFKETSKRMLLLGLAAGTSHGLATTALFRSGRLPDDLSALVIAVARSVPADDVRQIEQRAEEAKTSFFDTHPAPTERMASVRREAASGVFHLAGQATHLFKDFTGLSRT